MALTYEVREGSADNAERVVLAVWICLTKEEVDTIEKLARAEKLTRRQLLRRFTENAVKQTIARQHK
jgi:hypothetical protein